MVKHPTLVPNDFRKIGNPSLGTYVHWSDAEGNARCARADYRIAFEDFGHAQLARASVNYPHRTNYQGYFWFSRTRRHVWYESRLESTSLLALDFLFNIVSIASQPMCIAWDDGHRSFPDFFAEHADGHRTLYEVKPKARMTADVTAQFLRTRSLCKTIGWEFVVIHELPTAARLNLEWLMPYRDRRHDLPQPRRSEFFNQIHDRIRFDEARRMLDIEMPARSIHHLYHLMWSQELLFDPLVVLSGSAWLWRYASDPARAAKDKDRVPNGAPSALAQLGTLLAPAPRESHSSDPVRRQR